MATHIEFNCYYQGGGSLLNQTFCPLQLNGEPLQYTETRLVEDVVSRPIPWWILAALFVLYQAQKRK